MVEAGCLVARSHLETLIAELPGAQELLAHARFSATFAHLQSNWAIKKLDGEAAKGVTSH